MAERIKVIPVYCGGIRKMWRRHGDNRASEPPVGKILPGRNRNLNRRNRPDLLLRYSWLTLTRVRAVMWYHDNPTEVLKPNPSLSWPVQAAIQAREDRRFEEVKTVALFNNKLGCLLSGMQVVFSISLDILSPLRLLFMHSLSVWDNVLQKKHKKAERRHCLDLTEI